MLHVFGYGSLMHLGSLSKGLGRSASAGDIAPARLRGHRRVWGASELVQVQGRSGTTTARFLDLEPHADGRVNGGVIAVTDDEFASLRIREKSYAVHDVTGMIDGLRSHERCVTFASPPGATFTGDVVLAEYVRLVEEAFEALGPGQLAEFRVGTARPPVPVVEGLYRFVDPEQNARTSRAGAFPG